jgi:F0F1-type ATP synthase membrane subunit c/vacuolar-type H+-ATPase subunit K
MADLQPWHFTTWLDLFDHWQTLAAGLLVMLAAIGTTWATRATASRQIEAAREQADRMVAAAREQTLATAEQSSQTIDLARRRDASEALAFYVMLISTEN